MGPDGKFEKIVPEKVRISFDGNEDELAQFVVIYNSDVLSRGVFRQIARFGLSKRLDSKAFFSGRLQGTRIDFLAMIQSYGVHVEIVPAI